MSKEESWMQMKIRFDLDYARRKAAYDIYVEDLERQRKQFYKDNPDFKFKGMFMNVIAPPMKFTINIIQ